jgi:biopolymer transport protein ExbD
VRFTNQKRRQPPPVIIISLIDVLIVMLIFLMVTTTFKNQPALKLALPESKQATQGSSDAALLVTISKDAPNYYLGQRPITFDQLKQELQAAVAKNPEIALSIRPDKEATVELFINLVNAATEAGIKSRVGIQTRAPAPSE